MIKFRNNNKVTALNTAVEFCGKSNCGGQRYYGSDVVNVAKQFEKYLNSEQDN